MRAILTIACASVVFAAGAQAQEALKRCQQIKEDGERLKCYDGLAASPGATENPTETNETSDAAWEVRDEKSPLDDSPLFTASLRSSDGKASLVMRCKDRKTEVAVTKWGFVKCGTDVRVVYRIDQQQAVETPWNSHSSCVLAIAPSPIPFIRALTDQGKIYFRIFDHHDAPYDALFNVGKVSEVRSRLAQACEWDKATSNPPPKAPTPAASPSPPNARPK